MQYTVDIVFEAFDKTNATIETIKERARQLEDLKKNFNQPGKGAPTADPNAWADPRSLSGLMDRFFARLVGVAGVRGAVDAVTLGIRAWQYETSKVKDPLDKVFEKQAAVGEAVKDLVRDVPFVGAAIVRMMEAFGYNEGPKEMLRLMKEIENTAERTKKQLVAMGRASSQMAMEAMGFPASSLEESRIANAREDRKKEIEEAKKAVEQAKRTYKIQRKEEEDAYKRQYIPGAPKAGAWGYAPAEPDRMESDRIKKEILRPAYERLHQLQEAEEYAQLAEDIRLEEMRKQEQEKAGRQEREEFQETLKEKENDTLDLYRRLDEARARNIRDSFEREKELIRIRYQYEIQMAKEAGQDIRMLELLRDEELAGVTKPGGRMHSRGLEFKDIRYGDFSSPPWQQDLTGLSRMQADIQSRMVRILERMLGVITNNKGVIVSNYG